MSHADHHRTRYFLGRVMIVVCHTCHESDVSLAPHFGEGDLPHQAALRQEIQSTYEVTG